MILTGNHVCHNPRAFKEAEALTAAGFRVEWLGGWYDAGLAERDKQLALGRRWNFTPVVNWTGTGVWARLQNVRQRARCWLGAKQFELFGRENAAQLGYCARELFEGGRRYDADLYIAHSEPAMWAADRLSSLGKRIGIDLEDWFSEDLLPESRGTRPLNLLRSLEARLLQKASLRSCPSHAMSDALSAEYDCPPPTVVYNAFAWNERHSLDGSFKDRRDRNLSSIHWYSQTLGRGRGLEDLLSALPYLTSNAEIHLRGKPGSGFREWLLSSVPNAWRDLIFIHDLVANDELLSRIAEHDIGFAGEMKYCRSRDLTVTNKILHYLLGGLAVVASNTAGQREVAEQSTGAVRLYPSGDPVALAQQLNALLSKPDELDAAKSAALRAAEDTFCWERQVPTLLRCVENALVA